MFCREMLGTGANETVSLTHTAHPNITVDQTQPQTVRVSLWESFSVTLVQQDTACSGASVPSVDRELKLRTAVGRIQERQVTLL